MILYVLLQVKLTEILFATEYLDRRSNRHRNLPHSHRCNQPVNHLINRAINPHGDHLLNLQSNPAVDLPFNQVATRLDSLHCIRHPSPLYSHLYDLHADRQCSRPRSRRINLPANLYLSLLYNLLRNQLVSRVYIPRAIHQSNHPLNRADILHGSLLCNLLETL